MASISGEIVCVEIAFSASGDIGFLVTGDWGFLTKNLIYIATNARLNRANTEPKKEKAIIAGFASWDWTACAW